jgi:hypothetical protein
LERAHKELAETLTDFVTVSTLISPPTNSSTNSSGENTLNSTEKVPEGDNNVEGKPNVADTGLHLIIEKNCPVTNSLLSLS